MTSSLGINGGDVRFGSKHGGPSGDATSATLPIVDTCRAPTSCRVTLNAGARTMNASESGALPTDATAGPTAPQVGDAATPFRFYDNRQKYLAFVNTCNEKAAVTRRVGQELAQVRPSPPALRILDAGMGDATVLSRVMRSAHKQFPTVPLLAVAKEISLEDVRLGLEKMPDRFLEHPATVLVVTNLNYAEAPRLMLRDVQAAAALNWHELRLTGTAAHEYGEQ